MAHCGSSSGARQHDLVLGYPLFSDVHEINEAIAERWNDTVGVNDRVLVLGDVAMGRIDATLKIAGRLNGVKVFLTGNHDGCASFLVHDAWRQINVGLDAWGGHLVHAGRGGDDDRIRCK